MVVCICKSISEKDITTDCTTCFDAARSFFEDKKNILDD